MNRRTILKSFVAAPAAAALHAQTPPKEPPPSPLEDTSKIETSVPDSSAEPVVRFFTHDQFAALTHLAEIFEPSSPQTPGAREAHAAESLGRRGLEDFREVRQRGKLVVCEEPDHRL